MLDSLVLARVERYNLQIVIFLKIAWHEGEVLMSSRHMIVVRNGSTLYSDNIASK